MRSRPTGPTGRRRRWHRPDERRVGKEWSCREEPARSIRAHHERYDGSGYPDGLAGEKIPLAARLFAVADTLDAITTDRPYRPAAPLADARKTIAAGDGSQFDPR